jgi:hypothetical protein
MKNFALNLSRYLLASTMVLFIPTLVRSQNLYEPAPERTLPPNGELGLAGKPNDWGFLPFRSDSALRNAYGQQVFNTTRTVSLSMLKTSQCESADALSFIPDKSWFYASLGFSLYKNDFGTLASDIALQHFINTGGNVAIALSKPLYYMPHDPAADSHNSIFLSGTNSFLFIIPRVSGFFDLPFLDPGIGGDRGARLDLTADYRILDFLGIPKSSNYLLSLGIRGDGVFNAQSNTHPKAVGIGELYFNIAFLQLSLDYAKDLTHSNTFKGEPVLYQIAVMPVKINW